MKKKDQIRLIPNPLYNIRYGEMDKPSAHARVLVYAMDATGIQKIWCKEDVRELVFRMMLAFPDLEIAQNHFCNSYLFEFQYKGKQMKMEYEDLLACLGLYTNTLPTDPTDVDSWIDDLEGQLLDAGKSAGGGWSLSPRPQEDRRLQKRFDALFEDDIEFSEQQIHDMLIGKPLHLPERGEHQDEEYDDDEFNELVVYPNSEDVERARFVAEDLVNSMPQEHFDMVKEAGKIHLHRVHTMLQLSKTKLAKDFRLNQIPDDRLDVILRHLMKEDYRTDMRYSEFMRSEYAYIEDLAHLIWAKHHGLIFCMYEPRVDSRWKVDLRKFDGLGCGDGINLQKTWDYFRLSEIKDVFRGWVN